MVNTNTGPFESHGAAAQVHSMLTGYLTDETAEPRDVANVARMAVLLELLFGEEVLHQARYSPMYIAEILAVEILPRCAGRGGRRSAMRSCRMRQAEVLYARNWDLRGTEYRTTWTAGYWLERVMQQARLAGEL